MLTNNWTVTIVFNNVQNKQMYAELKSVFSITLHFRDRQLRTGAIEVTRSHGWIGSQVGEAELELNSSSFSIYCIPQRVLPAKLMLAFLAHAYTLLPWLEYFICLIHSYRPFKTPFKFYFSEKHSPQPLQARLVPLCISCTPLWENSSNYYLLVCFYHWNLFYFFFLIS